MAQFEVTHRNIKDRLKLTKADDWDDLCITADGEIFSLHASGSLTPEQLQEVVDLAMPLKGAA